MGLFQVYVREASAPSEREEVAQSGEVSQRAASPVWTSQISAANVEEAYRVGKAQFEAERPELATANLSIEAVAGSVEK